MTRRFLDPTMPGELEHRVHLRNIIERAEHNGRVHGE